MNEWKTRIWNEVKVEILQHSDYYYELKSQVNTFIIIKPTTMCCIIVNKTTNILNVCASSDNNNYIEALYVYIFIYVFQQHIQWYVFWLWFYERIFVIYLYVLYTRTWLRNVIKHIIYRIQIKDICIEWHTLYVIRTCKCQHINLILLIVKQRESKKNKNIYDASRLIIVIITWGVKLKCFSHILSASLILLQWLIRWYVLCVVLVSH